MVDAERKANRFRISLRTLMELLFVLCVIFAFARNYYSPTIRRGEWLKIQCTGTLIDQPIDGVFQVDRDGTVTLGPAYGRVALSGLSAVEAEAAISNDLRMILRAPEVAVSRLTGEYALQALQIENLQLRGQLAKPRSN